MTGHTSSIYSLAFSAESSLLVSGGADWSVRCWDVKSAGGLPSKQSATNEDPSRPMGLARNGAVSASNSVDDDEAFES
jgi:transcription initiation factor TFIID subunit 5